MVNNKYILTISESFRDLFKRQKYEEYVCIIINRSEDIFKDIQFERVINQSAGESDYLDQFDNKYDTKLLLNTEQGKLIGEKKNDLLDWINSMMRECSEFTNHIIKRDTSGIVNTELYKIVEQMIRSLKDDENGIFFIPYPVAHEYPGSFMWSRMTDFLQAICCRLKEENLVGERKIFFIYPSGENAVYVLRDMELNREYIKVPELESFISYQRYTQIISDN